MKSARSSEILDEMLGANVFEGLQVDLKDGSPLVKLQNVKVISYEVHAGATSFTVEGDGPAPYGKLRLTFALLDKPSVDDAGGR